MEALLRRYGCGNLATRLMGIRSKRCDDLCKTARLDFLEDKPCIGNDARGFTRATSDNTRRQGHRLGKRLNTLLFPIGLG